MRMSPDSRLAWSTGFREDGQAMSAARGWPAPPDSPPIHSGGRARLGLFPLRLTHGGALVGRGGEAAEGKRVKGQRERGQGTSLARRKPTLP